jgi:hypothetical protein
LPKIIPWNKQKALDLFPGRRHGASVVEDVDRTSSMLYPPSCTAS